ncbi:MAG: BrnT family toxin [Deltaproteobacteria bacterium]|nr:BrnT family toxin [Deltaproteobacteria bacterium]
MFEDFEWDADKAAANRRSHGVSFEEALTALADPRAIEAPDLLDPERHVTIGYSALSRMLFVVHIEVLAGRRTRIISARRASHAQRRKYEEG